MLATQSNRLPSNAINQYENAAKLLGAQSMPGNWFDGHAEYGKMRLHIHLNIHSTLSEIGCRRHEQAASVQVAYQSTGG